MISVFTDSLTILSPSLRFDELILDLETISDDEIFSLEIPRDKIRLALPTIIRAGEMPAIRKRVAAFHSVGFNKWQGGNLAAFELVPHGADLAADWPLYAWNTRAVKQLLALGCTSFALSPELSLDKMIALLEQFPDTATVILWQDTPLMISEACPISAVAKCGHCHKNESGVSLSPRKRGDDVIVYSRACRNTVTNSTPFDLRRDFDTLHAAGCRRWRYDFRYRRYTSDEAAKIVNF